MQGVADVEELFLPVQPEFVYGFGPRLSAEAVELLTVDTNEVAKISAPSENGAKNSARQKDSQASIDRTGLQTLSLPMCGERRVRASASVGEVPGKAGKMTLDVCRHFVYIKACTTQKGSLLNTATRGQRVLLPGSGSRSSRHFRNRLNEGWMSLKLRSVEKT